MNYLSVCSGIEAATVAWHPFGWKASAFSEIERFPRAVLKHHYPDTPLHGDFTTIQGDEYDPARILVGGTPCQSFSVAGLRKGMDDPRGNLTLAYLALAERTRPDWLVWENVPGVLSSNEGRDFGAFLGGLAELGYGFAYRVLDAQYFGVPQRRRRVFVVGHSGGWRRAAAVLFERHSLSGHSAPSREAREGTAGGTAGGVACCGVADTLTVGANQTFGRPGGEVVATPVWRAGDQANAEHMVDHAGTISTNKGSQAGIVAYSIQERAVSENLDAGPQGKGYQPDIAYTLEARNKVQAVANIKTTGHQGDTVVPEDGCWPTLPSESCNNGGGGGAILMPRSGMAVRRITPREAERLQGFPDEYTRVPYRNKQPEDCPDGPRYKALGNSMAVPVMRWIGERIQAVEALDVAESEAA